MDYLDKQPLDKEEMQLNIKQAKRVLALTKHKTRPISFVLNPELWTLFKKLAKNQGQSASGLLEDLMITQLIEYEMLDE